VATSRDKGETPIMFGNKCVSLATTGVKHLVRQVCGRMVRYMLSLRLGRKNSLHCLHAAEAKSAILVLRQIMRSYQQVYVQRYLACDRRKISTHPITCQEALQQGHGKFSNGCYRIMIDFWALAAVPWMGMMQRVCRSCVSQSFALRPPTVTEEAEVILG